MLAKGQALWGRPGGWRGNQTDRSDRTNRLFWRGLRAGSLRTATGWEQDGDKESDRENGGMEIHRGLSWLVLHAESAREALIMSPKAVERSK
jgi:hypothetical protein